MKVIVPDYYKRFKCIANRCKHTCCKGWEVEIDEDSLKSFSAYSDIMEKIETTDSTHFRLLEDEKCPFLLESGYCDMILKYGEDMLCQTCTDHPRFRNFWSDRIEMGLGLVCEEAARIILSSTSPMRLEELSECSHTQEQALESEVGNGDVSAKQSLSKDNGNDQQIFLQNMDSVEQNLDEDEIWLLDVRGQLLKQITEEGPLARLKEYLIFRHIPDSLYDDRLEERIQFVEYFLELSKKAWSESDGSLASLVEIVRKLSYDLEYDEEEKERVLASFS